MGSMNVKSKSMLNIWSIYPDARELPLHMHIVERGNGGSRHTMFKTIPKLQTECSIIMLSYNFKRSILKLEANKLKITLKRADFDLLRTSFFIIHVRYIF